MMHAYLRETLGMFAELQVPFCVLCCRLEGLDHFRAAFGPAAASTLLRAAARTLEASLWKTDFMGRWSNDQFLVILNGCGEEALESVCERVRHLLHNDAIEWWGERRSLPASIGQTTAQAGDTVESLMDRVQKSLDAESPMRLRAAAGGSSGSEN
jgi:diguanylate cyclase